ncbi:MAG: hypothetical protein II171_07045 [Bacteroidales bacterium]|nr:hypothetical protein [Bacteroidales bacterium]
MKFSFIKCAGALLAGALLAVACSKDYEADIKRIEEKVNNITASYNAEVPNLKQQTEALQTLLNQYNGDLGKLKETVEANKAAQDQQYAELLQKYNDLDKALKDYATKAELQQAIKECTDAFKQADKELGERIDALTTQIDNKLAEFEGKLPGLVQPYLDALKVELQGKLDDLAKRVDANESAIKTLNEVTIPGIQALVAANKEILDNHIEDYNTFKKQTNEAIQLINDALTEIRGILDTKVDNEAFEEYKKTVATLIAGLDSRVAANEKDIEAIMDVLNGVDKDNAIWNEIAKKVNQEDFNTFQADVIGRFVADELLIKANATAIAALEAKVDSLDKALNATIEAAKADAIAAANEYTDGKISALELKMRQELADSLVDVAARITAAYEKADQALYEKITAEYEAADAILRSDIDDLSDRLDEAFKQISDLSDAFDVLKAEFEALRDDLCSRMAVLEKQMDEILGRIQSVQFVPEYSDGKLNLNILPFYDDWFDFMAILPVASEVTYKINPGDVFESAEQIQEAIDANVLDLNFDVVYVKTRASASWADGPDVAIDKVINYDPKTGFLTLNVVANPQMLSDYLGLDVLYGDPEPYYVSVDDFMPSSFDEDYGYYSTGLLDALQYYNGYLGDFKVPVYDLYELEDYDYYKSFAENYAISLEIRRESPKAEEEVESNAINEDEEEGDEYEYNPNGKFDADQKQAIDGKLNNIASPYVVFYPNVIGSLVMPSDAYKRTGETETIPDVNGKPTEVDALEIYEETTLYLPYSATAEYPAYEKNADGKYEPYYYRTPLDGMVPAYEYYDTDGYLLFAVTYEDALKLGMVVPALTLRDQVTTRYTDENGRTVDYTWFKGTYNDDDWGVTWTLVDDDMTDDRLVTKGKKYFMAPYEEVTLADGSTKVVEDVYATTMMDANTKANVRRNAIDWTVRSRYYVDIAGFGNEYYEFNEGGYNEDIRYNYYDGYVVIVKPNLDVEGTATIKWNYVEDAAEDHNRAFGEDADTEYDRALVTINFTDLEFVDKEEPIKVLEYLDEAFNLALKDFSVADGDNWKIEAAKEGTAQFAEDDAEFVAYNAEENPEILAVWLVDENGKKVTDASKAKGLAFDINNFEWDKHYDYAATFETDYLDINFKLELTTIDRKHDPIVIALADHYFDVNGEEFEDGLYSYAESQDKDKVDFAKGMMNGFINLGILTKDQIKNLNDLSASATEADIIAAFYAMESVDPAIKYAEDVEENWIDYCNYEIADNGAITFDEDEITVNANWTAAQLHSFATADGSTVYQKITEDGDLVIDIITYVGQMVEFRWNVGYDVPHYDFVHQANYTYYDADKKFYWAQASPDYQNTFGSDAVHKLGHYDVMKMDVYANCFNVINAEGQILDRDFFEEDDRFFNDDAICILFRYAKDNANGVYSLDEETMAEELEKDDKMNVGIEYVNGEGETVSIAKYGDLWVDTTTFYYSSVREQFKMKGFLAVMSDGVRFDIPTSFETAGTIVSEPTDAVKKTLDIMGVEINGEVPYDEFELRQYVPFEFPDELDPLYINLTQEHRPYTVNLYQSLHFNDIRPDVGTKVINYEMLGWVVVNDELTWDWVIGNGGIDTPSAESNGFQYAPGNGEEPGHYETYWVPDNPFFWNPMMPWINGHQEDVWIVNPDYIADETVTSRTAYDIKDTFVMDPTNVPVDLRRRITIDEEAHTFTYDYDSQVLFSGEKGVDVSYVLYTRWMRPHTFDFEVVIRGLDVQGE